MGVGLVYGHPQPIGARSRVRFIMFILSEDVALR